MQKDLVFFKKGGEEGVALTSTSANHIANMAKEYIQGMEIQLNNVSFLNVEVGLISANAHNVIQEGTSREVLSSIPSMLESIAQAKSLIAWLREAIKAKNDLIDRLQSVSLDDWCEECGVEKPLLPVAPHVLTEQEYYASLPIKERNRYYQLETVAAVIGKYIHPNDVLSDERKKLKDRIQHPHQVDGKGRDALIYTSEPSVSAEDVDNTFYELQKKHREVQAQLNSMKHDCEVAIEESTNKSNTEYAVASSEYREALKAIMLSFKTWKNAKSQEYSKLKIAVPDSLLGVYNTVNSLGK